MDFVFHLSNYNNPSLEDETAELFRQRLEAHSRKAVPRMWNITDQLNAYAAKGPGRETRRRRYRVYGVFLIAMGIFALVPGLTEPRIPSLIWAGGGTIFAGCFEFYLAREKKSLTPPASCRKEAAKLLSDRRKNDWENLRAEVRFEDADVVLSAGESSETVPYAEISGVFGTEQLWLVIYGAEKALLLQKKDLVSGEAGAFLPYLQEKSQM